MTVTSNQPQGNDVADGAAASVSFDDGTGPGEQPGSTVPPASARQTLSTKAGVVVAGAGDTAVVGAGSADDVAGAGVSTLAGTGAAADVDAGTVASGGVLALHADNITRAITGTRLRMRVSSRGTQL